MPWWPFYHSVATMHVVGEMALRLASSQLEKAHAMITRKLSNDVIADAIGCSPRAVRGIRSRVRRYGMPTAPVNRVGRRKSLTPLMRDALFEQLTRQPDMLRHEMIAFLSGRFGVVVSPTTVSRTLKAERWSRKTSRRVAGQRYPDLRGLYLYKLIEC
jgi:transposase